MNVFFLILLAVAALLFLLDAFGVASRINLTAAGLFCWVLVPLITLVDMYV